MIKPDFSGARGSNAGDDFHELWALRQSLLLIEQDTSLTAVAVEGLVAEDETGPLDTWDGVDCTYYFGGDNAFSSENVVLEQLKYSASDPEKKWTIARLTYSEAKTKNNSIIRKLANAFFEIKKNHPKLVENGHLEIHFVSNQPVDPSVIDVFSKLKYLIKRPQDIPPETNKFIEASGLEFDDFILFSKALDFSQCGGDSRFAIEERILITISEWTEDDARTSKNNLLDFIRRKMLPESKGEFINRQSIFAQLGFSDPRTLFPCPTAIKSVYNLVPRSVTQDIANDMLAGKKRICLHGEGGCGKTTTLQELKEILPDGSTFIVYDCYGEGRYLDSDAYRHRSKDAFLQLSNELAQNLRTPLLISPSENLDYPRVFKKRLEKAADVVSSVNDNALLVIVIDAADNSVTAAKSQASGEKSFVHEFFNLGDLPDNVRFLVTARTGRLDSLELPPKFARKIEIGGFTLDETGKYVRTVWEDSPANWIEDFHFLSRGNPRVQNYALNYAGDDFSRAIDYLRPNGKGLSNVFQGQLEHARNKGGVYQDIKYFGAGLVALPRPIPLEHLAKIVELSEDHLRDICADLAPGIRLIDNLISFADEDFEHFIRDEAKEKLPEVRNRIADYFLGKHKSDCYAATHIATALFDAARGQEIIQLINSEKEPSAIGDPVLRRETQLQRLKIAMKVCKQTGNTTDAILTLLAGAGALKTDSAIQEMLIENPDLAANFARDTFGRVILRDSIQIENHGVHLFHLMASDARKNNRILVRESHRQLQAWLQRRNDDFKEQKRKHPNSHPHGWKISYNDIAAETEAILRTAGAQDAISMLLRWKPKHIALKVASILSRSLITSGDENLLEECLKDEQIKIPWKLFLLTPLAFTKKEIDIKLLEASLEKLIRLKFINLGKVRDSYNEEDFHTELLETILTACEIVISRGGNKKVVIPVLEKFAAPEYRQFGRLYKHQTALIDLSLRAFTLLENLLGRECVVKTYLINEDKNPADSETKQKNKPRNEEKGKLEIFIGKFIGFYKTRAKIILGQISQESWQEAKSKVVSRNTEEDYRLYNDFDVPKMNRLAALSFTRLMFLPDLNREDLLKSACRLVNTSPFNSAETDIFQRFIIDKSLHQHILNEVVTRVEKIKATRTSAEEKISALVRFARLILPFSFDDSESIFNDAITIAGEVNNDSIHEIALFSRLSKSAIRTMQSDKRREVAETFAIIASDAGIRLDGNDNFPWGRITQTLTNLDTSIALAAIGRWEDDNIVGRAKLLPDLLETALSNKTLTLTQIVSLFPLLDYVDEELIALIVSEIKNKKDFDLNCFIEEVAREELLRLGKGKRDKICDELASLNSDGRKGFWLDQLLQANKFHKSHIKENSKNDSSSNSVSSHETARENILNNFDWGKYKFLAPEEINALVKEIIDTTKSSPTHIGTYQVLKKIRDFISIGDRVSYLKALNLSKSKNISEYEIAREISKLTKLWEESPSVQNWNKQYILQLIIDKLPSFTGYLSFGDYPPAELPNLLARSNASDKQICEALLEATQRHVDSLGAPTVYALVGLITQYAQPDEAVEVIEVYSKQLLDRIPIEDRENWNLTDIPQNALGGFARYIYALMSDIDVRNRWRAAHSIRILARLNDVSAIDEIVQLYDRKIEKNYRKIDAPFYWIASRLWLVITLTRIANESPESVKHLTQWLLEIASDKDFPHVILREFAKSAISILLENKVASFNPTQLKILENINVNSFHKKKRKKNRNTHFDEYGYKENVKRRFHFNSVDTLPYWYSGKARMFDGVSLEEFIDMAEQWIVDKWEVKDNPWEWNREPRKDRISSGYLEKVSGHGHGSLPIADRFHTYLEWHAMWCSVGSLLLTNPLVKSEYDDSFEDRLKSNGLSFPPFWLVDFRNPKPLAKRFWFAPEKDVDAWLEEVTDNDFLTELQTSDQSEHIVVGSDFDTRSSEFTLSVRIDTALVSPETGSSLLKALQTIDNPCNYRIPPFGDELEIDSPPYKLIGWLSSDYYDSGIDERDPFRNEIRSIQCVPSDEVLSALGLEFKVENEPKWIEISSKKEIFSYKSWSDIRWDDYEERRYSSSSVRSNGWRLSVDKNALKRYLNQKGLDLIVEVGIVRKNRDYGYSEYNTKETKEVEFERLFILRRDGNIEAAEGHFGTW